MHFEYFIFLFRSYSFGIETINTFILIYAPAVYLKPVPNFQCFQTKKTPKTLHFEVAHTYMAYKRVPHSSGPNPFHDC